MARSYFSIWKAAKLALYPRKSLAHDSTLPLGPPSATELSIGHNVDSKAAVDAVMKQARACGATIVKQAQDTFWGGYGGYFQDPDGHLWEIVWNPQWVVEDEAPPNPSTSSIPKSGVAKRTHQQGELDYG